MTPEILDNLDEAQVELKRQIFKQHVMLVEIETHAKCNRICSFCPNSIVDRRLNKTLTDAELLDRVFRELGSIGYSRQIKVARYSEPLANAEYLYEQISSARALVPRAQLAIVSNTDYLTPRILTRLREAGLDVLYMSIYLKANEHWTLELANVYANRLAKKLGVRLATQKSTPVSLHCTYGFVGLELRSSCMNFDDYGVDRGASLGQYTGMKRVGPCWEPFETFVIDYTGAVMPCCNLRSDLPQHRDLVVADLSKPGTSIFDAYAGRLSAWRRSMVDFGQKDFPCTTCLHRDIPVSLAKPISARLRKRLTLLQKVDLLGPA